MTQPLLSIVIPAHNEESRLPTTLDQVDAFLSAQPYQAEVVVVENGSQDRTLELAQSYAARLPYLRVIHEDRRGKGLACQVGMLAARGAYRFIRHPMYASLLLLAWGICFKAGAQHAAPLLTNLALAGFASLCLYLTARVEERENLRRFGEEYRAYMRETKRFIPFLF